MQLLYAFGIFAGLAILIYVIVGAVTGSLG